ncbi:MAG TPA: hypothetical protein PLL94_14395 [Bacteroidales bacterium]|jgi:hypothetical protein|nr:MAG: hypothetical protein BWX72_00234 [Firmicutes bacterium ADurb.Bin080]HQK69326.1 hypothetical protein [Bacteroidales bacterium]
MVPLLDRGHAGRNTIIGAEIMMSGTGKDKIVYEEQRSRIKSGDEVRQSNY